VSFTRIHISDGLATIWGHPLFNFGCAYGQFCPTN
jgi:hypothetical protein